MRLIDVEPLIRHLKGYIKREDIITNKTLLQTYKTMIQILEKQPTVKEEKKNED